VLSDEGHGLTNAAGVLHPLAGPNGSDIDAPTTFLVDRQGSVRWLYRAPQIIARLSPDDVLQAIDQHLK
jgi:peroxiredoxin